MTATVTSRRGQPGAGQVEQPSFVARLLMLPIRAWRLLSVHLPARCRFHPSCSQYALDALSTHGAARGTWLAIRRVGRCHPWHDGGIDPVPPKPTTDGVANTRSTSPAVTGEPPTGVAHPPAAEES